MHDHVFSVARIDKQICADYIQHQPSMHRCMPAAGKYVPSIVHYILQVSEHQQQQQQQQQQQRQEGLRRTLLQSPLQQRRNVLDSVPPPNFRLVGAAIGNGFTNPRIQTVRTSLCLRASETEYMPSSLHAHAAWTRFQTFVLPASGAFRMCTAPWQLQHTFTCVLHPGSRNIRFHLEIGMQGPALLPSFTCILADAVSL